jgi:alpha,alpha-trehalase
MIEPKLILLPIIALLCTSTLQINIYSQTVPNDITVETRTTMMKLLEDEDTDGDNKITINDFRIQATEKGDKRFVFKSTDNHQYEIAGTYYLSNLLKELQLQRESGFDTANIKIERIFEQPVDQISRSIKELYWKGLTRQIDEEGLLTIIRDEKATASDSLHYIYVPSNDKLAVNYFNRIRQYHPQWNLQVVKLPEKITSDYVKLVEKRPGILSLQLKRNGTDEITGLPFVVPGGRFNEMYGWDSYFIVLGLLKDGNYSLAKSIIENIIYEINHYGAVLNANRSYYLTRSQPPFLSSMGVAIAEHITDDSARHTWLSEVLAAVIKEYKNVWMNPLRITPVGLNRYFDLGNGIPPEVEAGHYDPVFAIYAGRHRMDTRKFEQEYRRGKIKEPELDQFFVHDRAMRESGHDTSYRLLNRCADLATVDLNSLLYKIESDIANLIEREFNGRISLPDGSYENSTEWFKKADNRKILMNKYMWDTEFGLFFDYDFVQKKKTHYVSATVLYPLWAKLATVEQAGIIVQKALPLLEMPGGIVSSTEESRGPVTEDHPLRQWDYPFGWAPHQILVWQGLLNYGYSEIACRLAYRWLFTITLNAYQFNGTMPEKFDVVKRSHDVFAEYGNIGTKFSYITKEGFGWTNASYQIGLSLMNDTLRPYLNRLIPPEWIFDQSK